MERAMKILWSYALMMMNYQNLHNAEMKYSPTENFLSRISNFSTEFYQTLAGNNHGNIVSSPISTLTVLSMLAYGAGGKSRGELLKAIHLPINQKIVLETYRDFIQNLTSTSGVELHLSNNIFVQNNCNINQAFRNVSDIIFQSKVQNINFEDTNEATDTINQWVRAETMNRITDIVKPEDLIDSVMMMVNAVYFKGDWMHSFSSTLRKQKFYLSSKESITIPTMCNIFNYNHGLILKSTAFYVELPYKTNNSRKEFSMYIIVPFEHDILEAVTKQLQDINFAELESEIVPERIKFCMPKFKIESHLDLKPTLRAMGIQDVFTQGANLSSIVQQNNVEISEVIQKAFLSVDEVGTEAAVTTIVAGRRRSAGPLQFEVDKPFICAIVWKPTGTPLIWARVNDPSAEAA